MENLSWKDILETLISTGDNPAAAVERLSQEAELREREAQGLRKFSAAIEELVPKQTPAAASPPIPPHVATPKSNGDATNAQPPRGAVIDTIRAIMRTGGVWTPKALLEEMEKRDVVPASKTPIRSVEGAINRLWREQKVIERVGTAQYKWAEGHPASPSLETLGQYADPIASSIAAMKELPASENGEAQE